MDAINYTAGFQNPIDSFNRSFASGNAVLQQQLLRDQQQAQIAQAQAQAEQARLKAEADAAKQAEINTALNMLKSPNATYDDYMKASMYLPKDQSEAVQKAAAGMNTEQKSAALMDTSQVFSAFRSGETELAASILRRQAEAERNSGNTKGAEYAEMLATMAETSPDGAKAVETMIGYTLTALPGGKDTFEAISKLETERRAASDYPALVQQMNLELAKAGTDEEKNKIELKYKERREQAEIAKIEAETFKMKLDSERPDGTKIDESARALMNKAVDAAMSSELLASQAQNLADGFEKSKPPTGWTGSALEWMKKAVGGQDQFTRLKNEYVKLRNTEVLKNLLPGVASDKDIEIALSAFPPDNSSPEYITLFLQGMARLQQYNADINKAKAEWVNQNGSLGPAQVEFTAGGKPVKKGMAFWDFTKAIPIPNVIGKVAATTGKPVEVDY